MIKLSDYVIRFVAGLGVKHVFLVTGGGAMHLNDSLANCKEIEFVCNLHEQASAICAENYSKATNHFGVCMVTTGPGATNAVTGVAGAWLDSTPCLFLSGQVKRSDRIYNSDGTHSGLRQLGVQEIDAVSIVKPITKYAATVTDPLSVRYHLEKAVHLARTGRPGPVWIDIPLDVQAAPIDETTLQGFVPDADAGQAAKLLEKPIEETIAALQRAQRPLIFVGNGVRLAGAEQEFQSLRQILKTPVVSTWCAADLVAYDDPLFCGRPGGIAPRAANFALQNCDFLLVLGARMDLAITGFAPEKLARAAHKTMVDIDAGEIKKMKGTIHTPVVADVRDFLREFLKRVAPLQFGNWSAWISRCDEWKKKYPLLLPEHQKKESRVSIYNFASILSEEIGPDCSVVSGSSGTGIEIFLLAYRPRLGQRAFHTAGLGAMGFALPASIAVSLAGGRRPTVCVDGDGGFQFNIQELETVRRLQLPIKFFVLNNEGYASIRNSQINYFGAPKIGCTAETGQTLPDIRKVAAAYGLGTAIIRDQSDLREELQQVLRMPGPVVCDVHVIPDEIRGPRLSTVQRADGSLVSRPLEDLWPFLDREEFRANMIVPPLEE